MMMMTMMMSVIKQVANEDKENNADAGGRGGACG
jgi:hypothetical protein